MTVERLLDSMGSREFSEWMAFAGMEPIGGARGDVQAAIVACATANAAGNKTKPADFVPLWEPRRKSTVAEQIAIFKSMEKRKRPVK